MQTEKISIDQLVENPNNTRIHTDKQIKEFSRSIEMFGVVRPIVVDENNMILIGHGLKLALEALGRSEVDILRVTGLSEKEKKKLLLSDNKIYDLGVDDFDAIDQLIRDLQDFEIPGYDAKNLEMLYGASSLAKDEAEFKQSEAEIEKRIEKQQKAQEQLETEGTFQASPVVQKAREEQQKENFVICPHCGGKVYVN